MIIKSDSGIISFLFILFLVFAGACADDSDEQVYIPPETSVVDTQFNFHVVDRGIWRSAQPNVESILRMKKHGLKSIVNLRGDSSTNIREKAISDSLGLRYFNYPLDATEPQNSEYLREILEVVSDTLNQPVLIHCLGGKDRTGLIVGLYKKVKMNIPLAEIEKEMIIYGHDAGSYTRIIEALRNFEYEDGAD